MLNTESTPTPSNSSLLSPEIMLSPTTVQEILAQEDMLEHGGDDQEDVAEEEEQLISSVIEKQPPEVENQEAANNSGENNLRPKKPVFIQTLFRQFCRVFTQPRFQKKKKLDFSPFP